MADNNQNQNQEPSLIGGHAQYVKGAAESAIGDLSGSHAWKSSGQQDLAAGQNTMKMAGDNRDSSQGFGKMEELAGKATGCDGMKEEGAKSQKPQ